MIHKFHIHSGISKGFQTHLFCFPFWSSGTTGFPIAIMLRFALRNATQLFLPFLEICCTYSASSCAQFATKSVLTCASTMRYFFHNKYLLFPIHIHILTSDSNVDYLTLPQGRRKKGPTFYGHGCKPPGFTDKLVKSRRFFVLMFNGHKTH